MAQLAKSSHVSPQSEEKHGIQTLPINTTRSRLRPVEDTRSHLSQFTPREGECLTMQQPAHWPMINASSLVAEILLGHGQSPAGARPGRLYAGMSLMAHSDWQGRDRRCWRTLRDESRKTRSKWRAQITVRRLPDMLIWWGGQPCVPRSPACSAEHLA